MENLSTEKNYKMPDYNVYIFSLKQKLLYAAEGSLLTAIVAWLFYQSVWGMVVGGAIIPLFMIRKRHALCEKQKKRLCMEFRECLQSVSGALTAGYAMENAWKTAEKDLSALFGGDSLMVKELVVMNRRIGLNVPMEQLLNDFAVRSGSEDVEGFCQVFQFAKRGGGDLQKIIRNASDHISDRIEIDREIDTLMAAKRLEQKLMSLMPLLILMYIGLSSPGFLEGLYHNAMGILLMSACLTIYGVSILLAEKIVSIQI